MASLWQRHRPIVTSRAWAQAWTASPALAGRVRQRRPPWQRLEAPMWTAAQSKATRPNTTDDTNTPPTPPAPKPEPANAPGGAKTPPGRLPGSIANVLDLDDTHRVPIVTYSPTEELFTMDEAVLRETQRAGKPLLESRVAVNKYPNKWYLVEYYLKLRETMVAKGSVFHKRWRGTCASAAGRFLSMHDAVNQFCGNLGRRDWERDPARETPAYQDFRALDAKSTSAHVEYLKNGQAAALWVSIAPERYDGAGGGGFPTAKALHYYAWANRHPPWKYLLWHLQRSPSLQLRAPSISPSEATYQIYPDGRRPAPPPDVAMQPLHLVESCYFLHFMPLLMETFGPGGRRVNRLWGDGQRNDNLPVVLVWQDMYVWFLWRNGPEGPLEMQQAGWWLPQIPPGQPNYAREQKLRIETEEKLNMPPYGKPVSAPTGIAPAGIAPSSGPPRKSKPGGTKQPGKRKPGQAPMNWSRQKETLQPKGKERSSF